MHTYGPKSTLIAQGLVEDINVKDAYGPRSAPMAQGLVYDINATHAFGLRELKRTYGFVSTPIAQGLVEIINAKDTKMLMSPKAQGLVSNTHHSKSRMEKHCAHDRMSGGKTTKRHNSGSVGKKTISSDETNHSVVSLLLFAKRHVVFYTTVFLLPLRVSATHGAIMGYMELGSCYL